jgi:hypothetical protein
MFVFGSWVCVADGAGSFRRFLVNMKPKTPTVGFHSDLDKVFDNLDDLSIHGSATRTEEESAFGTTPSSAATTLIRLDPFQSEDSRSRSQLGLCNLATDLQEADISESLSTLEKDLDSLLQLRMPEATARRGASGCFGANGVMITSTPEGRFVPWKGMKLSDLLEAKNWLVAPNADDENDADLEARRTRNRARAARRRRVNERMRSMHIELDAEFAAVSERGFRTPVANITRVTAILERSNDPNVRQALRYTQRAWIQLDQQNPASTVREERVGES